MKKLIIGVILATLLIGQSSKAADREWATVGKILTGAVVINTIDHIVRPRPQTVYVVVQQAPVVTAPVVITVPQQIVYVQQPIVYYNTLPTFPQLVHRQHHYWNHGWNRRH